MIEDVASKTRQIARSGLGIHNQTDDYAMPSFIKMFAVKV
jgi:hypothetical protein